MGLCGLVRQRAEILTVLHRNTSQGLWNRGSIMCGSVELDSMKEEGGVVMPLYQFYWEFHCTTKLRSLCYRSAERGRQTLEKPVSVICSFFLILLSFLWTQYHNPLRLMYFLFIYLHFLLCINSLQTSCQPFDLNRLYSVVTFQSFPLQLMVSSKLHQAGGGSSFWSQLDLNLRAESLEQGCAKRVQEWLHSPLHTSFSRMWSCLHVVLGALTINIWRASTLFAM